MMPELRIQA